MAYGLQVNSVSGEARLYENSWFMTFYSSESHTLGPNTTKDIYITGFDPNRWGVVNLIIQASSIGSAAPGYVTLNNGYIRLQNSSNYLDNQFDFTVLKGN
jgi:hypothetical protein